MSRPPYVGLGYISGIYGVRGWVRVFSYTVPREQILEYRQWHMGVNRSADIAESMPSSEAVQLESGRMQAKGILAKLVGVEDRDAAAELIGCGIFVPRAELPKIGTDEYYWADLEGLQVMNVQGESLGRVDHLMETGVHDVLVLDGGANRMIPFVPQQVVLEVDLQHGVIKVDWDPEWWE